MPLVSKDSLEDAHEERIQKLEESQKDTAVQLSDNASKIDHLGQILRTEMERLGERFEHAIGPVVERVARIEPMQTVVTKLEADNDKRNEQFATAKKAFLAIAIGGFSILGKEVFMSLWHTIITNAH